MKKYDLPSREQCFDILNDCHTPAHIVRHCEAAAKVGVFLADRLNEKGITVDVELVDRACLLHDVLRVCGVRDYSGFDPPPSDEDRAKWERLRAEYGGVHHEEAACRLLTEKCGYPELGRAVKSHKYRAVLDERERPKTWEEKLVYYADKRVMHDKIVTLKERLDEVHRRHAGRRGSAARSQIDNEQIDALIFELEREIFEKIGLQPNEVTEGFIDSYGGGTRRNSESSIG